MGAFLPLLLAAFVAGCRTAPHLPPVDFSGGGWRVRHGQAVWKPAKTQPELAGELLLAIHANGDCIVQFDKTPFPLAAARLTGGQWQIEFGAGQRRFGGRGQPPSRFVWFQLPRAVDGAGLSSGWKLIPLGKDSWRLENARTGETLEGALFP
ncbi:MAG: hypothetical protein HYZ36_00195 [Pedosphaera parvula]|nr:hypothetical protein [Pedosphaera parvula]